jgi:hypothetical protein
MHKIIVNSRVVKNAVVKRKCRIIAFYYTSQGSGKATKRVHKCNFHGRFLSRDHIVGQSPRDSRETNQARRTCAAQVRAPPIDEFTLTQSTSSSLAAA